MQGMPISNVFIYIYIYMTEREREKVCVSYAKPVNCSDMFTQTELPLSHSLKERKTLPREISNPA